ncbi:trypsin-like peptidase domain-containing protein [Patescibacteria group bacterium]|nr:trypsin-like peptidase domain-containing protein [Patescibacteria group bacterium]
MNRKSKIVATISLVLILILLGVGSGVLGFKTNQLPKLNISGPNVGVLQPSQNTQVVTEESVTIDVVKKVTPTVVTVAITPSAQSAPNFNFGPFGFFEAPQNSPSPQTPQNIGSGFIVQSDGLIVTNKHVVSDTSAKYRVITADNKSYDVQKIYRDPNNDLAIIKINATNLPTVTLGNSNDLQVGQFAIAIGTALGEFRSTVTTGVVSGIGRDITAGAPFQGSEQLNNIIQTSAAINPGNSGGPLLNSSGQVIGINVATASNAQNIGFALPVDVLKSDLNAFETAGGFPAIAYLGVQYQMVSRQLSILNEIPEGAYIQTVVSGSPAEKAGVQDGDIITKINGQAVRDTSGGLSSIISKLKPGNTIDLTVYRDGSGSGSGQTLDLKATLTEASQ